MKIYHFKTPKGSVDVKVDQLGSAVVNLTVMDIKFNVTDGTMLAASDPVDAFKRQYTQFAGLQSLPTTVAALTAIATTNNIELKVFDQQATPVVLNTSTTSTTTTTTTGA